MTLLATSNSDDELIDNAWHVTAAWPRSWQERWGDVSSIVRPSLADKYSVAHVTRDTALCPSLCTCLYVTTQTIRRPSVSTSQWIPSAASPATVVLAQYSMWRYTLFWFYPLKCSICLVILKFFSKTFSIKFWAIIISIRAMPWWLRYLLPLAESPVSHCLPLPGCSELWRRCSFKFEMMFPWLARPLLGPCPGPASCCSGIKGKFSPVLEVDITTQLTNHSWCPQTQNHSPSIYQPARFFNQGMCSELKSKCCWEDCKLPPMKYLTAKIHFDKAMNLFEALPILCGACVATLHLSVPSPQNMDNINKFWWSHHNVQVIIFHPEH